MLTKPSTWIRTDRAHPNGTLRTQSRESVWVTGQWEKEVSFAFQRVTWPRVEGWHPAESVSWRALPFYPSHVALCKRDGFIGFIVSRNADISSPHQCATRHEKELSIRTHKALTWMELLLDTRGTARVPMSCRKACGPRTRWKEKADYI